MVFLVCVTAQAEFVMLQTKCSIADHLASLNIKIQLKFLLQLFVNDMEK